MGELILRELLSAIEAGEAVALATVVDTRRSVPRHAGTKMLVYRDGRQTGTVGGGEMEARVIDEAVAALTDGRTRVLEYQLVEPASGDPGVCGGEMQIYLEPHMPAPTIFVVGCGHVGRAVAELAHWLDYRVVATDDRAELATPELVPDADVVVGGPLADALEQAPVTDDTHVVVVTRNVDLDLQILPLLVATPARSIGVMGSRRRWETTRRRLVEAGVSEDDLARIVAPIGLELHAETPAEIALSILAEIVQLRRAPTD